MSGNLNDARHWYHRAAEMRALAAHHVQTGGWLRQASWSGS